MKVLPAVITSLEREAEERGEPVAIGLSRVVQQYKFIATLYMMCDVLPKVSRLSCIFQFSTIDMSTLDTRVSTTVESLKLLNNQAGEFSRKLDSDLLSSLSSSSILYSPEVKLRFQSEIQKPFVEALVQNVQD